MVESLTIFQDLEGNAVELDQVDGVDSETLQGRFSMLANHRPREIIRPSGRTEPSHLGRHAAEALVSRKKRPMSSSLRPMPYTSAVSKKFEPLSHAERKTCKAVSSVTLPQFAPICQVPRPTSPISRPVFPKLRVFIPSPFLEDCSLNRRLLSSRHKPWSEAVMNRHGRVPWFLKSKNP